MFKKSINFISLGVTHSNMNFAYSQNIAYCNQETMETIVLQIESSIRTSLVPFLIEEVRKYYEVDLNEKDVQSYVSAWLKQEVTTPPKTIKRSVVKKVEVKQPEVDLENVEMTEDSLKNLKIKQLVEMCKARGITGTSCNKAGLIAKLLNPQPATIKAPKSKEFISESEDDEPKKKPSPKSKKVVPDSEEEPPKKAQPKAKHVVSDSDEDLPKKKAAPKKKKATPKVIEVIEPAEIITERDDFGNIYDPNTGFVFNTEDEVEGVRDEGGHVRPLTKEDIEACKARNLRYTCPYELPPDE